ncbi:hypothetical protein [Pseudokineococcus sp. 1T1Z-3]|uniref:hypothetical protein n=1 Tax=Pseudokineococcus sp. 1T1Z-3 TaxID=3132745 RepID=UPI0030B0676E
MYLQQRPRRASALAPVLICAALMVVAASAALLLAASAAPLLAVQLVTGLGLLALVGVRLTAPRALAWWSRPAPGARRRRR